LVSESFALKQGHLDMEPDNNPSLSEAREYIYSIDFSKIISKMVNFQGWLKKDALTICKMYRNYLYLQKKYGSEYKLPPSLDMDEFWHAHILDTKQYRKDCQGIFGKYFDHYPYFGIDGETDMNETETAFKKMSSLYAKEFNGEQLYQIRGMFAAIMSVVKKFIFKPTKQIEAVTVWE
jgi:hypothetical protein